MLASAEAVALRSPAPDDIDQRVVLFDVPWEQYEALLAIRGESARPRMTYLSGELELMSPSIDHERIKKTLARLLEMWAFERGLDLEGYGSWTLKNKAHKAGAEPDECYVLNCVGTPERPDLAIEVQWSHGGKLLPDVDLGLLAELALLRQTAAIRTLQERLRG